MNCLERIRRMTERLGVYDFDRDQSVTAELHAYSAGITKIEEALLAALSGQFPSTADDGALRRFERLLHLNPAGELEQRRRAVYEKLGRCPGAWSRQEYFDLLAASGFTGTWTEEPASFTLRLHFEEGFTVAQMRDVFAAAYRLLPAHLRPAMNAQPLTWDQIDGAGMPFSQWDESCVCWDAVDA